MADNGCNNGVNNGQLGVMGSGDDNQGRVTIVYITYRIIVNKKMSGFQLKPQLYTAEQKCYKTIFVINHLYLHMIH